MQPSNPDTTGLLLSGGIDSAVLLGHLLKQGRRVQPFYINSDLCWAREELAAVRRFLAAVGGGPGARRPGGGVEPLVVLDLPLADLDRGHWSVTGRRVPDDSTPDEAVYLPGRNPLLIIKAAVWCQMHGIPELALAPLEANPFPDATAEFFAAFEEALGLGGARPLKITRPFAELGKHEVLALGRDLPLEHTFSCIAPADGLHCGRCNKCGERLGAFRRLGLTDPAAYAEIPAA